MLYGMTRIQYARLGETEAESTHTDKEDDENRNDRTFDPVVNGNEVVTSRLTTQELTRRSVLTDEEFLVHRPKVNERKHEELNRENDENVVDVESRVTVVESEESINR